MSVKYKIKIELSILIRQLNSGKWVSIIEVDGQFHYGPWGESMPALMEKMKLALSDHIK